MTEEEKEAIEFTENLIETIKQSKMLFDEDIAAKLGIATQNNLQIVLNLIQKQQAEKEQLKAELKNKDKIIDGMACTIYDYANLGKLKICGCELEDGKIDLNLCNQTLADRNCCDCIKGYFEKKVEESNI